MGLIGDSRWAKLSCCLLVITLLLHLICFSVPHWAKTQEHKVQRREHIGLWRHCTYPQNGHETCTDFINQPTSDWLKACQSFMTLAMFALLAAIGAVGVYAFSPDLEGDTRVLTICLIITGTATVFNVIGVSVYGARYREYFSNKDVWGDVGQLAWAWWVGLCVCICNFFSFLLILLEMLAGYAPTMGGSGGYPQRY
ncbi:hypothetical protein NP493_1070g00002 [Ridgeia piscesae]|uniref:Uncharacterized protein n=1 Tax=Ridgeia piscesae TaxID=27915 RepID=A0AAD9KJ07_RIDPI|nr:hypothetical protein NP493_1070g00002 [Ridgeia piscesae]